MSKRVEAIIDRYRPEIIYILTQHDAVHTGQARTSARRVHSDDDSEARQAKRTNHFDKRRTHFGMKAP